MLINKKQIRPMPRHVYVRMESLFKNTGQIDIPDAYKTAPHIIGTVEDHSCQEKDIRRLEHKLAIGDRVIVSHYAGRLIQDNIYDYSVKDILAIISGNIDLQAISQDVERCKWCGNAKTGIDQSVIMWEGRCPRCGKDKYGIKQPVNNPVSVSDAEVAEHEESIYRRANERRRRSPLLPQRV